MLRLEYAKLQAKIQKKKEENRVIKVDGPPPPPQPVNIESQEYLSEANRFKTFSSRWPLTFIRPADLANAGFIYTGQDDIVQCVFCR